MTVELDNRAKLSAEVIDKLDDLQDIYGEGQRTRGGILEE